MTSQVALTVKISPANAKDLRDMDSIPGLGRSPGGGHGNTLQYSCLENPMDRGAWRAMAHRVAKSQTWLKWLSSSSSSCQWTFRLLPCLGYCKQCYSEYWVECIFSDHVFHWINAQEWDGRVICSSVFSFLRNLHSGYIPIYIPTDGIGKFPYLHTLCSIYCLWIFWW